MIPVPTRFPAVMHLALTVLAVVLLTALPAESSVRPPDAIAVPGGPAAISQLLGYVDTDPDAFAGSVNRVLLRIVRRDGDWTRVPDRNLLASYLDTVRELEVIYSGRIVIEPHAEGPPATFLTLAALLGFETGADSFPLLREKGTGRYWEIRRRTAIALGWNLRAVAHRLRRGETVVLEIPSGSAYSPIPLDLWSGMTGTQVSSADALSRIVRDQKLGLMIEGLRRSGLEGSDHADAATLRQIYLQGPIPFYRYGVALELRDGRITVPGGDAAREFWEGLVGVPLDERNRFIRTLFHPSNARAAHLWHALHFAPSGTAGRVFRDTGTSRKRLRMLMRSFERLQQIEGQRFLLGGRGNDRSMTTIMRSLPEGDHFIPPGFRPLSDTWLRSGDSLEDCPWGLDESPLPSGAGNGREYGDTYFFRLLSSPTVHSRRPEVLLRQVLRVVDLLRDRTHLLTPGNVRLLRRTAAFRPAAMAPVLDLTLDDPGALTSYLYAATDLDCRDPEGIHLAFQGGIELLAALSRSGALPTERTGDLLLEWSEMHTGAENLTSLAGSQFTWLRSVRDSIPQAGVDDPGRGPMERRFLASLSGVRDPQEFRWRGMDYRGERGRDLAAAMAAYLESQHILSFDRIGELLRLAGELDSELRMETYARCGSILTALERNLDEIPVPEELRIQAPEFGEIRPLLEHRFLAAEAVRSRPVDKLNGARALVAVRSMIARELRAGLYAIAYLNPVALLENPDFDQPLFVHGHSVRESNIPHQRPASQRPTVWTPTALVPSSVSPSGSHLVGNARGVGRTLVERHVLGLDPGRPPHTWIDVRQWLNRLRLSRWHTLDPTVLRFISAARRAGAVISPGGAERTAPVEAFQAAVAWLDTGTTPGGATRAVDDDRLRELLTAREALGPDWWEIIQPAGFPTPHLNGRIRPWIDEFPPYEALETEASVQALRERMFPELWITVGDYLHRNRLPAALGFDMMFEIVQQVPREVVLETERDWRSYLDWILDLDDAYFDDTVKACLLSGKYEASEL